MKLIYCKACGDVVRLLNAWRECRCYLSGGRYVDPVHVEISGPAIPLGIDNLSFQKALEQRPKRGLGQGFCAFVIPEECDTVTIK